MKSYIIIAIAACLLAGCGGLTFAPPTATATPAPPSPTGTATYAASPTASAAPSRTPTPAPSATPTATWVAQGPDQVSVPILMFHHIAVSPVGSRYYVPPAKFEDELKLLHNWGYTTISTTMLVQAIEHGASLPPRPLILTFDDANEDNYTNAFPIMEKYGFTGVLYLPYDYIGTPGYLTVDQVKQMAAAGWEVGSHTLTHPGNFLFLDDASLRAEIVELAQEASGAPRASNSDFCLSVWRRELGRDGLREICRLHCSHGRHGIFGRPGTGKPVRAATLRDQRIG